MSYPSISVCCNTFNGAHRVEYLLKSIRKYDDVDIKYDLVLLDDCSSNINSRNLLKKLSDENNGIFIQNEVNLGISKSWNRMCEATNSDIIVLLNDDILVNKDWLKNMVFFLTNNEHVGSSSWRFYFITMGDVQEILNDTGKFIPRDPITKELKPEKINDFYPYNKPGRFMCPAGCCFAFTRDKFNLSGGFPKDITTFYEESLTKDRLVFVKENEKIELLSLEELYTKYYDDKRIISNEKSDIVDISDKEIYTLSSELSEDVNDIYDIKLTDKEKDWFDNNLKDNDFSVLTKNRKIIGKRTKNQIKNGYINKGCWGKLSKIVRHKTTKDIFKINCKNGETICTEDHSLITVKNKEYLPIKSKDIDSDGILQSLNTIPKINTIKKVDLLDFISDMVDVHYDKDWIWVEPTGVNQYGKRHIIKNGENVDGFVKIKRILNIDSIEFDNLLFLIGQYISDGSFTAYKTSNKNLIKGKTIFSHSNDKRSIECINEMVNSLTNINIDMVWLTSKNKNKKYKDVWSVGSGHQIFCKIFVGMCNCGSKNKCFPSFVYSLPRKKLIILFNSLMKGDGYRASDHTEKYKVYSKKFIANHLQYTTISQRLISGVCFILSRLGIKYIFGKGKRRTNDAYNVRTILKRSMKNCKRAKPKIEKVEYDGYVYDLEVDNSHIFLDSCGLMLVHNSSFGTALASKGYASYGLPWPPLYHVWSQTFKENSNELKPEIVMQDSRKKYIEKWGGDFDYTNPLFMSKIPEVDCKWLAEGKIYTGNSEVWKNVCEKE